MIGGMAVKKTLLALVLALLLCLSSATVIFAADDDAYSVISPQTSETGITYCDNLLISVKTMDNTPLRFTLYSYPNYTKVSSGSGSGFRIQRTVPGRSFRRLHRGRRSQFLHAAGKRYPARDVRFEDRKV